MQPVNDNARTLVMGMLRVLNKYNKNGRSAANEVFEALLALTGCPVRTMNAMGLLAEIAGEQAKIELGQAVDRFSKEKSTARHPNYD